MLTLLSPAKKLLKFTKPYLDATTQPLLHSKMIKLARVMKTKSVEQLAGLMDLSKDLAVLNFDRYQHFKLNDSRIEQSYPAIYLFQGDVYQGLQADTWSSEDIEYSQEHLGILSGLYGLLRPLDRIQPYRLEMGVRLENPAGNNLYEFWQDPIAKILNQKLAEQSNPVLINLASTEYFKAVNEKKLRYPVITINFYEQKNSELKMIGIYAKKARGLMAKFIIQNQIDDLNQIKDFTESGYCFNQGSSSDRHLDFVRDQ